MSILNTLSSASRRSYGMMGNSESVDPHFKSVHLLLHLDQFGTSVKNETVLDSSIYAAPIVRPFSNTSQSSYTPYSNGYSTGSWSTMFAGTSSLTLAFATFTSSPVFQFGTGDFTVEFWVSPFSFNVVDSAFRSILDFRTTDTTTTQFAIGFNTNGQLLTYGMPSGSAATVVGQLPLGEWAHIAVVRSGSNFVIYINGVISSTIAAGATNYTEQGLRVGSSTVATVISSVGFFISNLRITKGQVLYTGAFSPSTIPITISTSGNASGNVVQPVPANVSFLSYQNVITKDNSLNAIGGTTNRGATCQFNPFAPLEAYSPKRHGGSYLGGPITVSSNSIYVLGTSNFTIEFWASAPLVTGASVFEYETGSVTGAFFIRISGGASSFAITVSIPGGTSLNSTSANQAIHSWNHIALVRNGTTFTLYTNGRAIASTTSTTNLTTSKPTISNTDGAAIIADFRMVNGTAVYTSDFNVPTSPLQAIPNTVLLLSFANASIYDSARMANFYFASLSFPGVDTQNEIFGNASLKSIGATSRFTSAQLLALPNGGVEKKISGSFPPLGTQFTIEMWIFKTSTPTQLQLLLGGTDSNRFYLGINTSNQIYVAYGNPTIFELTTTLTVPDSQWTHIAVTKTSAYLTRVWVNGQLGASGTQTTSVFLPAWNSDLIISDSFVGNIDEIRISGIPRYSQPFTPSGPFPDK